MSADVHATPGEHPRTTGRIPRWFEAADDRTAVARHPLADDLRAIIADLVQLDLAELDPEDLASLGETLATARAQVAAMPSLRTGTGGVSRLWGRPESNLFERSPFTGRSNALAVPLVLRPDGDVTRAHATYGDAYEGPPGCVHGGHVIAAFDDLLGVAQSVSGLAGMTGTLTVRLRRTTPLHTRIDYEAEVDRVDGRKIYVTGRSFADGELLSEAEGIFVAPRGMRLEHPRGNTDPAA